MTTYTQKTLDIMTLPEWFIFFLVVQVVHFLATWKLYVKAGRQAWEAAVPVYNAVILMKIINRPWWWVILIFIPVINIIMIPIIWVETIRSFGQNSTKDTLLVLVTLGFYIFYVNYALDVTHIADRSLKPRTGAGEWTSSILFAIVAATVVHTYFMQPYTIPTGSLEKTLLVGDFLFVSKFHYGARIPMTTVSLPMVHDSVPLTKKKSYFKKPQLPYMRIPGLQKIKRNDIVVFSWPADTVVQFFKKSKGVIKPIDKKSNYVKRCVAIPGDTLSLVNGYVHINGVKTVLPERAKPLYKHLVTLKGELNNSTLDLFGRDYYGGLVVKIPNNIMIKERTAELIEKRAYLEYIKKDSSYTYFTGGVENNQVAKYLNISQANNMVLFNMTEKEAIERKNNPQIVDIQRHIIKEKTTRVFPQNNSFAANEDNMASLYIPEEGKTIGITTQNIPLYKRIIEVYEGREIGLANKITTRGTEVLLNGTPIKEYTFKQDYYWMMGDNRHNSEDSRFWGFVPFNHVVGKPVFVFFSKDGSKNMSSLDWVRWDRVFTTVGGDGEPKSYLLYFLIVLAGYFGYSYVKKRKKANTPE